MSKFSAADTLELPVAERLQLVEDIWDTIAVAPEALPLSDEDKRLIDERLEARRRDPPGWCAVGGSFRPHHFAPEVSHRLIIRPETEAGMTGAFDWYEECRAGLGHEFNA
jgi:putative addiction module component (TIGR02574 family)